MAVLPRLREDILDNPIALAEFKHIHRAGVGWFWRILYLITALALFLPLLYAESKWFHRTLNDVGVFLLMLNFTATLAVELRAINLADRSMSRERTGGTWELLVMTGVDTWRVVLGKWLGVIRAVRRDFLFLIFLRASSLFWLLGWYFFNQNYGYWRTTFPYDAARLSNMEIDGTVFVLASLIMGIFLLVELGLVTALPLAFSQFRWTRKQSAVIGLTLRIAIPIVYGMFIYWQAGWFNPYYERPEYSVEQSTFLAGMVFNLGDQGLMSSFTLVDNYARSHLPIVGLAQTLGFFTLIGLTLFLLRFAKFAAYTQNVSEPGFIPKGKAKREIRLATEKPVKMMMTTPATMERPQVTSPLNIPNAGMYRCVVSDYNNHQLTVSIYPRFKTEPEFKIVFADVTYHAGAMSWDNANIIAFDETERKAFMRKMGLTEADIASDVNLYGNTSTGSAIRILARSAEIMHFQ